MTKSITTKQWAWITAYALVYPASQLVGGWIMGLGIFLTLPFLMIGQILGMYAVSLSSGAEAAYIWGQGIAIFAQATFVVFLCNLWAPEGERST